MPTVLGERCIVVTTTVTRGACMPKISQFWLDRAAGVPLGPAWTRKDAQIELLDGALLDEHELTAWMRHGTGEQLRRLRTAVDLEAA